jgi:hypothetical protein
VTPQGLALKAHLTSQYMEASLRVYRELRQAAANTLAEVEDKGYRALRLEGNGEAAEIFRLTCLEHGVTVLSGQLDEVPRVEVKGADFAIDWPDSLKMHQDEKPVC